MENFKIEHFKRNNPADDFPAFNSLTFDKIQLIYDKLLKAIGGYFSPDQLVKKINELETLVKNVNANNEDFLLKSLLCEINIHPQQKVYVNWYRFDNIDELYFADLNMYFSDIWYPSSDDIDIFDSTFSWLLSISHDGTIKYLLTNQINTYIDF